MRKLILIAMIFATACGDDAPVRPDAGADAQTATRPNTPPTNCPIGHCPDARP